MARFVFVFVFLFLSACYQPPPHTIREREMTVGIVQKKIHKGMSQADVANALGSPNIVTNDGSGKEVWIYDKVATEASYSQSSDWGTILILGFSRNTGSAATTQRTLTVIIKFDENKLVETFSYHATKF